MITEAGFTYRSEVDEYFTSFQGHEAVTMYEDLFATGFRYSLPSTFALCLTFDLEIDKDVLLADYLIDYAGSKQKLNQFAIALKNFCLASDFQDFFIQHQDYYLKITYNTAALLGERDYVQELEEYYGVEHNSYNIIPVALYGGGGGFGPHIDRQGKIDAYSILCPMPQSAEIPYFGDKQFFEYLQRHEFSHTFVNRVTDKYHEEAMEYQDRLALVKTDMDRLAYGSWITCLNEHIVRAATTRMSYADSKQAGERARAKELAQGFLYIDAITRKLEEYENNRDIYPTFESFYLELLQGL